MRIGIISEGTEDQGVIKNILIAVGKISSFELEEVISIRSSLSKDETSLNNNQIIGTFQGVKNACLGKEGERADFQRFFIDEDGFVATVFFIRIMF